MTLSPPPIAHRVRRLRVFCWRVEVMESGGLWVWMADCWTRWGARRLLRDLTTPYETDAGRNPVDTGGPDDR